MPSRNVVREFVPESYYHVYNRGVEKRQIFLDAQDYTVFLGLLKKYLTGQRPNNDNRHVIKNFSQEVELLAFCLMPNHFHLLFYQEGERSVSDFMRRLITGYVMYFNDRYKRVGGLFQGPYKASLVDADSYLHHISRYIHLNPEGFTSWPYSSLQHYLGGKAAKWVKPERVMDLFDNSPEQYRDFVQEYVGTKKELESIKWQLANDLDA